MHANILGGTDIVTRILLKRILNNVFEREPVSCGPDRTG